MFAEEYLLILFFKLFLNERIQKFTKKKKTKQTEIPKQNLNAVYSVCFFIFWV